MVQSGTMSSTLLSIAESSIAHYDEQCKYLIIALRLLMIVQQQPPPHVLKNSCDFTRIACLPITRICNTIFPLRESHSSSSSVNTSSFVITCDILNTVVQVDISNVVNR